MMRHSTILWQLAVFIGAAVVTQTRLVDDYTASLVVYIGIAGIVAIGLTLLTGVGGMTSFGQAAFVGLGAYTTAALNVRFGMSPWETLPCSLVITGVSALLIGGITVRLAGHFLPLGTIAWGLSLYFTFGNIEWLGGHDGLRGIQPIALGSLVLVEPKAYLLVVWIAVAIAVVLTSNLLNSRIGRALRSLREEAAVGAAFGVDANRLKLVVFVYAALLAGTAGWLYAHFQRSVAPGSFGIVAGIEYLLMAVIGGPGHVVGAIAGSALVTVVRDQLQNALPSLLGSIGNYETVVFGCLIVIILQTSQRGIGPVLFGFLDRRRLSIDDGEQLPLLRSQDARERLLTVRQLTKRFGGLVAVKDVDLVVARATIVGLIGPNGAGKSTTFNLIAGSIAADSGQIDFNGEDIRLFSQPKIASCRLARTFQHPHVVHDMTVIENVMLGAHVRGQIGFLGAMLRMNRAEERRLLRTAYEQIRRVGLEKVAFSTAGNLSLGELRLLEIARALCLDPLLVMLDEPAAGLRVGEKRALANLLRDLRQQGLGILLVEHDMSFVMSLVDDLFVLNFGSLIARGRPAAIREDEAVLKAYLGTAA
ncbi:branched-chain amino acid ABC transporter ATP-binding protein/permease [Bradyrhizobium tropiciagri]|uniref:branched-chain amino acid ABC transporter ATP-binding protein/permease n=1 Tax=Bradyrhizobium tropiciagri TaxID=312253 RepID=UPI001BA93D0B|nr:branched-chain amino acid ABC transporter ATP-binding protein/permease [Bradyrhizobium tropiciagri]MBR0896721.1 branched-chain amino acid ABC transporter ATP-binding protein/permease [Bradyrhizobium tropiciagri]